MSERRRWTVVALVTTLALVGAGKCESAGPAPKQPAAGGGGVISARYHVHWTGARANQNDITVKVVSSRHTPQVWNVKVREGSFSGHVDLYKGDFITVTASQLDAGGLYLDLTAGNGSIILDAPKQREDPGSITAHYERPKPNQAAG